MCACLRACVAILLFFFYLLLFRAVGDSCTKHILSIQRQAWPPGSDFLHGGKLQVKGKDIVREEKFVTKDILLTNAECLVGLMYD